MAGAAETIRARARLPYFDGELPSSADVGPVFANWAKPDVHGHGPNPAHTLFRVFSFLSDFFLVYN
jgi:hypothetical protein